MAVNAIQLNNNNDSRRISYIQSGIIGAAGGYALKYVLPVSKIEKQVKNDEFFSEFKNNVKKAKLKEIDKIRNSGTKTEAIDEFIKIVDGDKISTSKLKALKEPVAKEVKALISRVNNRAREVKAFNNDIFKGVVKQIRPTKTFIAAGAGFALATAFVHNVISKIAEERRESRQFEEA